MATNSHSRRVRSLFDNPAGRLVGDRTGSHWEWDVAASDDTSTLLRKLENPALAIDTSNAAAFNPYDHAPSIERG